MDYLSIYLINYSINNLINHLIEERVRHKHLSHMRARAQRMWTNAVTNSFFH